MFTSENCLNAFTYALNHYSLLHSHTSFPHFTGHHYTYSDLYISRIKFLRLNSLALTISDNYIILNHLFISCNALMEITAMLFHYSILSKNQKWIRIHRGCNWKNDILRITFVLDEDILWWMHSKCSYWKHESLHPYVTYLLSWWNIVPPVDTNNTLTFLAIFVGSSHKD